MKTIFEMIGRRLIHPYKNLSDFLDHTSILPAIAIAAVLGFMLAKTPLLETVAKRMNPPSHGQLISVNKQRARTCQMLLLKIRFGGFPKASPCYIALGADPQKEDRLPPNGAPVVKPEPRSHKTVEQSAEWQTANAVRWY